MRGQSSKSPSATWSVGRARACSERRPVWLRRLLLEDEVDEDLEEDEGNDDDVVALLEEGASLWSTDRATPQHADAPVYVLLRLLYGFNGTLKFTEVGSFFPQTTVVFAFVSFAARGVLAVGFR